MDLNHYPLYNIWRQIKTKCYNPNNNQFERFGALGVVMDETWKESFDSFFRWANENGYQKDMVIAREKNAGDFTPTNCFFLTKAKNWYHVRGKEIPSFRADDRLVKSALNNY